MTSLIQMFNGEHDSERSFVRDFMCSFKYLSKEQVSELGRSDCKISNRRILDFFIVLNRKDIGADVLDLFSIIIKERNSFTSRDINVAISGIYRLLNKKKISAEDFDRIGSAIICGHKNS